MAQTQTQTALSIDLSEPRLFSRWMPRLALLLALGGYTLFLYTHFAPAISTPDSNGYWAQASLIANTGHTWFVPEADTQYIGMHWLITPNGQYISRYPPGLPMIVAAVYRVAGYKASVLVGPAMAVLSLLGLYLLARRLVPRWWAVGAVLLLCSLPIFTQHALASESHMGVTFCLVWGTYLLLRWLSWPQADAPQDGVTTSSSATPLRLMLALVAGLLLGAIPTIRYPDAVMGLGIAVFLLWSFRPRLWIDYLALIGGAAVPIGALLIRNQLLLGAFWRTGYALTNEQTGFSWAYFQSHFFPYIRTIQSDGLGLAFALGIAGIVWMCATRRLRALGIMLLLQTLAMVGLYMAYYWAPQAGNATMRFLLPLFPGIILAAVWMLFTATTHAPRLDRIGVPLAIVSIQFLWGGQTAWVDAARLYYQQDILARVTDALEKVSAPGDVVIAGNQIQQNLDFVRHWKLVDLTTSREAGGFLGRMVRRFGPGGPGGPGGDGPSPMQREKMVQRQNRYEGMDNQEREQAIADDVLDWVDKGSIYFVGTIAEMQQATTLLANQGKFQIISRVILPDQPQLPTGGGPFGMGGPGGGPGGPGGMAGPGGPGAPGGMQPMPGGPMGGPMAGPGLGAGPGMPDGAGGGMGGFGPGMRQRQGGMMPGMGNRGGFGRAGGGGGGPGGMMGGSLNGQHEAIIARWVPATTKP